MNRGGRVTGRSRVTRYGVPSTKLSKAALSGASSDRSRRGIALPRTSSKRSDAFYRGVSTVDVLAFSNAIRGVAGSAPLFHKTRVMRYDPLKKNMVRPFRALFNFVFGLVRGVLHSVLAFGTITLPTVPSGNKMTRKKAPDMPTSRSSNTREVASYPLRKAFSSHTTPHVESHPLRCFKRSISVVPQDNVIRHHTRNASDVLDSSREIAEVLKTYNTSQSRDRLITKLEDMKSNAAECIKSLSQRTATEQTTLTRRDLLLCQQEMIHLSKRVSGLAPERRSPDSLHIGRCQSALDPPRSQSATTELSFRELARDAAVERPSESRHRRSVSTASLAERVKTVAMKKPKSGHTSKARSESLRMQLKQHEHMVDFLKSKHAVLSRGRDAELAA